MQVIERLREILAFPLKAVLMTGDTSSSIKQLPGDPLLRIIAKPIQADEMLTVMRELIAS